MISSILQKKTNQKPLLPVGIKPYFADEEAGIYVIHGDCRDVLPALKDEIHLVLTDPPYGIGLDTNYKQKAGRAGLCQRRNHLSIHGDEVPFDPSELLVLNVPMVLWGGNYFCDKLPTSSGWLVWDKMRPAGLDQHDAELAWTNFVKGVRQFRHLWNGMMRASEHGTGYHPTQKPVALWMWVFSLRWTPAGTVLDPYMGSGSALVAAKQLGRRAIGIEIEERYCEIATQRIMATPRPLFTEPEPEPVQQALFDAV